MNHLTKASVALSRSASLAPKFTPVINRSFGDTFKDREAAEENIWVRQEEEKLMKKLVDKMKFQTETGKRELKQILGEKAFDKLGADTIHKLIDWKYH
mmetsp:Transcript_15021/g.19700  ORF Transcript_15021/g.19700 Transcript_15021/m.19700 type:complete len:98 (-) Transcript_15021:115-408(-)